MAQASGAEDVSPVEVADPGLLRDVSLGDVRIESACLFRGAAKAAAYWSGAVALAPEDIEIAASVHARFVARP